MFNKNKILSESLRENTFSSRINFDKVFIVTLSDLHIGAGSLEYIQNIIKFILSIPNMFVVLGGDLINNTTKTSKGNILEEYATGQKQIQMAVELLSPLVQDKRILAICGGGNHEKRSYNDCFISIPQMIATMLEIPNLYTADIAIGYIDVRKICYMYGVIHKHFKSKNYYEHLGMDILVMEHTHELNVREKLVLSHNKYAKVTTTKTIYEIDNGSALALPSYAKFAGYRILPIGCYIAELSGTERNIIIWKDSDLYNAIQNGYKTL